MNYRILLSIAIAAVGTAGCGQKGPLYLPPKNGTVITRPASSNTSPAPAQQTDKDKKDKKDESQPPQ